MSILPKYCFYFELTRNCNFEVEVFCIIYTIANACPSFSLFTNYFSKTVKSAAIFLTKHITFCWKEAFFVYLYHYAPDIWDFQGYEDQPAFIFLAKDKTSQQQWSIMDAIQELTANFSTFTTAFDTHCSSFLWFCLKAWLKCKNPFSYLD